MTSYVPCPTCRQYSHSIGEDQLTKAFRHFQSMFSHRGDGFPTQHVFDKVTRDAAQVLMAAAERERIRVDTTTAFDCGYSEGAEAERQAVVDWLLSDGARLDYEASGSEEHFSWWAADVVLQGIRDALEAIEARKAPK